jgi:hypothetical protein
MSSRAICFRLCVFVAVAMVLTLRFILAMTLGVGDNTSCAGGYR